MDGQSHPSNISQMNPSRAEEQRPTNGVALENNEKKPKQSLEVKPGGGVTVLDASSSPPPDDFNPGWRFYASFTSLCIITLAVALDATTLSVALPVIMPPLSSLLSNHLLQYFISTDQLYTPEKLTTERGRTGLIKPRSSPNHFTAAPSRPFGAGHPSSYPPPSSNQPSLRYLTSSAANPSSSSPSSSSP